MAAVVPQKPMILSSSVDFKFMPKMPAIMAPMPAAKPAIDKVNSSLLTCNSQQQQVNAAASTYKYSDRYMLAEADLWSEPDVPTTISSGACCSS